MTETPVHRGHLKTFENSWIFCKDSGKLIFRFVFQCPRGFKTPRGLKYHMALHTGIAAFHCGECGKAFITRDKLLLHQKSRHSNERPHACEWCGKGFLLAHKLAEHRRRVHTGEKPFKCNMCDQRFTDSRYVFLLPNKFVGVC